jgi:hypothetical protein
MKILFEGKGCQHIQKPQINVYQKTATLTTWPISNDAKSFPGKKTEMVFWAVHDVRHAILEYIITF